MVKQNRITLKGYFETGDIPSQAQYADLIDSKLNLAETGVQVIDGTISSSFLVVANQITASGNISSSGNILANTYISNGVSVLSHDGSATKLSDNLPIFLSGNTTSSNNISSSATIQGLTGSFGNLNVDTNARIDGDVFVSRYIRHTGDNDTHIEFLDNKIQLHAGNLPFITIDKDSSTPHPLTINNGGNRINFRVQDKDSNLLLKTDSEAFKVNLYYAGNQKLETQTGGVNITGHITASGNLKIDGSQVDFTNLPTSDPGVAGRLYNDSGTVKISL